MISLIWNLKYNTYQHIFETKTYSQTWKTDMWLPSGGGEGIDGWTGSLGLADTKYYVQKGQITRSYSIAQGAIFNIL